jgi:leucyl-tRNA synthetase
MLAAHKFVNKFWLIHQNIKNEILSSKKKEINEKNLIEEKFQKFTNEMIEKISKNLDNFHYNVIIANFHETYNFLSKLEINKINNHLLLENYVKILTIMSPVIPHLSSECIDEIQKKEDYNWPAINKEFLIKKTLEIVIQLNGKKRGIIACDINVDEEKLLNIIKSDSQFEKYFKDKTIIKTIYVKGRLINLILK